MSTLRRVFGVGGALALTALLGQSQCDNNTANTGGETDGGTSGTPDLATPIVLPGPPTELQISSINPPSAPQDRSIIMSIGGTGFQSGATVTIGGAPCTGVVVSPVNFYGTVINCTLAAQAKTCGALPVVVTNPDNKSITDNTSFSRFPGAALFAARAGLGTNTSPDGIVTADLNGDTKADIIYTQRGNNNIAVRLGVGDGTFGNANVFGTGTTPIGLALGDFNGDGKPDVVTGNNGSSNVSILLGNPDGTFQAARTFAVGAPAHGVAVGDFNGDTKLDVIAALNTTNQIAVLLGAGDGNLGANMPVTVSQNPAFVATGDFNRDSKLDFVSVETSSNSVSIRLGNGNGTFVQGPSLMGAISPAGVAVSDINGDKFADIIVTNQGAANNLTVYIGTGQGTFATPITSTTGIAPRGFVVTDLNRDGLVDVAVANQNGNSVSILLGDGNGRFTAAMGTNPLGTLANPFGIVAADFNGDGNRDLVTTDINANQLSIFLATEQCR
jgi:hypothetical protein